MSQQDVVEVGAPDIEPFYGNTAIPYVTTFKAKAAGPHVVIVALTHGNELCGVWALKHLFERGVRPVRGKLSLCFANVAAYARFDPAQPRASRYLDEDLNRLWHPARLERRRASRELERARELRPLIEDADYLLDLHSMQLAAPPLLLCGEAPKGVALARAMGYPTEVVADGGHANGTRMRDYGGFGEPDSGKTAMLVECGQHWAASSVEVAIATCAAFLHAVGALAAQVLGDVLPKRHPQRVIEVTHAVSVGDGPFVFTQEFTGMETIPTAGTVIAHDGGRAIRTPYDDCVLIMPSRRLVGGLTAVRLGRVVDADAA